MSTIEDSVTLSRDTIRKQALSFIDIGDNMLASIGEGRVEREEGEERMPVSSVREYGEIRRAVQELRNAFGCGEISLDGDDDTDLCVGGIDLSTYVSYINDAVAAISGIDDVSLSDLADALSNVRSEAAYLDRVDPGDYLTAAREMRGSVPDDVSRRIARMSEAFSTLEALGFITAP